MGSLVAASASAVDGHAVVGRVIFVIFVAAVTVATSEESAGDRAGVVEADGAGALHVNSSNPELEPVLLNGVDALSVLRRQQEAVQEQHELIHSQTSQAASLQEKLCTLHPPYSGQIFGAGSGTHKWAGGVLAPDGRIFGVPFSATSVLIINPATNTLDTTTITGLPSDQLKWHDGVLSRHNNNNNNNAIYCFPSNHDSVLKIDPSTNTADWSSITGVGGGALKFRSGVVGNNGLVYGIPYVSDFVLIVDPATDSLDKTTLGGLSQAPHKWQGGVVAPDGRIFCIPRSANAVLIIDPDTNTLDTTSIRGLEVTAGGAQWIGGVLAGNGLIYGIPYTSDAVLLISPDNNTADTTTITGLNATQQWFGGVLAANGKVAGIPRDSGAILVVDPASSTAEATTLSDLHIAHNRFNGGVLAANGHIYAIPEDAEAVLVFSLGC